VARRADARAVDRRRPLTLADILLFGFAEFGAQVGQKLDEKLLKLNDWYGRVAARESVAKSK